MKAPLSSSEFTQFNALIEKQLGICFDINRKYLLGQALLERASALQCSGLQEYYKVLCAAPRMGEWKELTPLLTVGETYFFRGDTHITALSEYIIPQLILSKQKAGDTSPIRVLSCACSTGEEPYTLALLFRELFPLVRVEIIGVDLNPVSLETAKKGGYSARAVHRVPAHYLSRYFQLKEDPYKRDEFHLIPEIKKWVSFQEGNLVDPNFYSGLGVADLILCRNVLIYFATDTIKTIIARLRTILHSDSFLILGHSENIRNYSDRFEVMDECNTFFYRLKPSFTPKKSPDFSEPPKLLSQTPAPASSNTSFHFQKRDLMMQAFAGKEAPKKDPVTKEKSLEEEYLCAEQEFLNELFQKSEKRTQKVLQKNPKHQKALLLFALLQAGRGALKEAQATCETIQELDEFAPESYCVQALLYESINEFKSAKKCYETALFLSQNFAIAHFKLAQIHNRFKHIPAARKEYQNTLKHLDFQDKNTFRLYSGGFSKAGVTTLCNDFLAS